MSRPHTQVPQGKKTLERINGESPMETVFDHLLPAEGRGEQAFCLTQFFSSSSSEIGITAASGVGEEMGQGGLHLVTWVHLSGSRTKKIALRK